MPKRTKRDALGWPDWIKNTKDREKQIAKKMKGLHFEDVVLKGDKKNVVIPWNLVQKFKRNSL